MPRRIPSAKPRDFFGATVVDPAVVLEPEGLAVMRQLPLALVASDFYLAGGTALALRLGHRVSVDFDFFSEHRAMDIDDRRRLVDGFRDVNEDLRITTDTDGTLIFTWLGVSLSFFRYPYRMLEAPTQREGLPLAGTADIAAMKLSAIIGRGSRKDFIDLDALLTERPLADWMTAAERKFDTVPEFRRMALRALLYFEDADVEQAPRMLRPLDWEALKARLRRDVGELGRADLGVASW
jgi:hypothetical protein